MGKIIISLLLICSIGYSQPSTFFSNNKPTFLNASHTPRVACGLRHILESWTTNKLIRVRRSNDNAESDIGWKGEALDTVALKSFVGSNSAFVKTMYDQSGNGLDVTQTTAANQPRIVNAGVIDRDGFYPCLYFDGVNDFMTFSSIGGTYIEYLYFKVRFRTSSGLSILFENSTDFNFNIGSYLLSRDSVSTRYGLNIVEKTSVTYSYKYDTSYNIASNKIIAIILDRTSPIISRQQFYLTNLILNALITRAPFNESTSGIGIPSLPNFIGGRSGGVAVSNINFQELIVYTNNYLTDGLLPISNINGFYEVF